MERSVPKPPAPKTHPQRRVRGSRTGRPIMALLDLFGRRWSLRILWELRERSMTSVWKVLSVTSIVALMVATLPSLPALR